MRANSTAPDEHAQNEEPPSKPALVECPHYEAAKEAMPIFEAQPTAEAQASSIHSFTTDEFPHGFFPPDS